MYRRHRRLSGVLSLFDLALMARSANAGQPRLPTSARLRRDIGLPKIADEPTVHPMLHRQS
jgi:hypothetical protein